jgi:hypothetical protein
MKMFAAGAAMPIVSSMGLGNYTPSTETRRLSGVIERRGTQTGMSTPGMFLFGVPFTGVGVFVALIGAKVVPVNPSSVHAPYFVLTAFGTVFGIAGLMLWSMAWKQFKSNRRRAQALERHATEPALEDYDWDPRGFRSHCWARVAKAIAWAGFLALFLSMFNWWAWFEKGPFMVKGIVSLFDLILLGIFWYVALMFSRAIKFGNSQIEYVRFPYRANEAITVRWLTPPHIRRADKGSFTLRCVKEWMETTGTGRDRRQNEVHEEQWSGTWSLDKPEDFPPGKNIDLEFQPVAGLPVTSLSGPETYFWEFEVNLSLPGPDFKETYLVPVY